MTFSELKKELQFFYPAYVLESFFSHNTRRFILRILFVLLTISFVLASGIVTNTSSAMTGAFFLLLILTVKFIALEGFFFSYRFHENGGEYQYDLAQIVFGSNEGDLTLGFIKSTLGYNALLRAGIDDESIDLFLQSRKQFLSAESLNVKEVKSITREYISALVEFDGEFRTFLQAHAITPDTLWGSFCWASDLISHTLRMEMWWSADQLSLITPIGRTWAYGEAFLLKKYSTELHFQKNQEHELHEEEIKTLEILLSKNTGANTLIVGDEGSGKMEIIEGLARKLSTGRGSSALRDREYIVLSVDLLLSSVTDSATFEKTMIALMNEVVRTGNVVFIVPDLPALLSGSHTLGVDLGELLSPYLRMDEIHIIGICNRTRFHNEMRSADDLLQHFSILQVSGGSSEAVTEILMEEVIKVESEEGVFFTYPAILESVTSAQRYFVSEPLYDSASDLLIESVAKARLEGRNTIVAQDVLSLVKKKTGIAAGAVSDVERKKLLELESLLHERVIGQHEAIRAIADALRRARSGINNPSRPLGSFLFLGPTGVGKTETTKALGEIFFGQDTKILRIDMSEYNTPDAVNRLIGGFDSETGGVLADMIRDHQYGVLLLDEFEKTDSKVLDLFLQILDEGVFSDAHGKKVSARNLIIIATSNAGSQIIFDTVKRGGNVGEGKEVILDSIIRSGVFKPELINRFDGVILFTPLQKEELRKVAELMLGRLIWRMKEKGMTLVVNDALLDFLVAKGNDPKFGARPLNRVIQDVLEERIARGIIDGTYRAGSTIEFSSTDLNSGR